ncbi:carbohydrate-binding module family 13 protein [Auriscalpium vulgare]|uniref:Carbohydrate-binding module family 13 protein n=1 Tax=Auriscalpium vulgare TaxID=40419 RepID=A0ACB8RZ53_9AGAM|nr:carbohydrate-binding module family 13 protein [Auriscalpium vulgare]
MVPLPRVLPPTSPRSPVRPLDPGVYTLTDVRWGMSLDLSGADDRSLIGFGMHGWENQQWEFSRLGAGYMIRSMHSQAFATLDGFNMQSGGVASIAAGSFPVCWDLEVLTHFDSEDEDEDIYARIRWPNSDLAWGLAGEHVGARVRCLL